MTESKYEASNKFQKYLKNNLDTWIREEMIKEMIRYATAANMPESFVKNISLEKLSSLKYKIVNTWKGPNNEPLPEFFEYGTSDVDLTGTSKVMHWIDADGSDVFVKKRKGLKGFLSMTKGFKKGKSSLKRRIKTEKEAFQRTLRDHVIKIKV